MTEFGDRTRPLLFAQAAKRGAEDWRHEDAEAVIAHLLAENEALAASPEVAKLVAEAEARGMERAADTVRSHGDVARAKLRETYDSGDARGNTLWGCIVGHLDITDDAIRAEAAAIRRHPPRSRGDKDMSDIHDKSLPPVTAETPAQHEERTCTCGAGHGSLEGHTDWCDFVAYQSLIARGAAEETGT